MAMEDTRGLQFGEFLRAARERRGLTLMQVASTTKIPQRHLDAIEHGDLSVVPEGPYRRGEVRAFAQAVGLDLNVALAQLEAVMGRPARSDEASSSNRTSTVSGRLAAAFGVFTIGVIALMLLFWSRSLATSDGVGSPAKATAPVQTPTPAAPPRAQPTAAAATTAGVNPVAASPVAEASDGNPAAVTSAPLLVVTSDPPGARVVVDGIGRGSTPVTIEYLPAGEKQVRIVHDGYMSDERTVRLAPNQSTTLHVELQPVK
jgi:transcriptional regulator with XRE-family HTH domain